MAVFNWSKGLVKKFFWGGLLGVVIGTFLTTKREKGSWEKIGRSADELLDKTQEQIDQAQREIRELSNREKDPPQGNRENNHQRPQNNS